MSEEIDSLNDMIRGTVDQWMAQNGGGMVTGLAMVVDYFGPDGERAWATALGDGQTPSQTLGLLRYHTLSVEHQINSHWNEGY